jgi:hypothetical protein
MLWFAIPALAAVPICLDDVPSRPRSGVRAEYDPASPPRVLVPMAWHRTGDVRPAGVYHDGSGRTYAFRDVEAALLANPHSERPYVAFREALAGDIGVLDGTGLTYAAELDSIEHTPVGEVLATFDQHEHPDLVRALCLYNATQGELLDREAARERLLAEIARIRTRDDPPMAVWGMTSQLYAAMGVDPPDDEAWRADVAAVAAELEAGATIEALLERARIGRGPLTERVHPEVPTAP